VLSSCSGMLSFIATVAPLVVCLVVVAQVKQLLAPTDNDRPDPSPRLNLVEFLKPRPKFCYSFCQRDIVLGELGFFSTNCTLPDGWLNAFACLNYYSGPGSYYTAQIGQSALFLNAETSPVGVTRYREHELLYGRHINPIIALETCERDFIWWSCARRW
jgi:hypothetical protein